jgi:DNA polymerase
VIDFAALKNLQKPLTSLYNIAMTAPQASQASLTADDYWTADQLKVMRGLELPTWFNPTVQVQTQQQAVVQTAAAIELAMPNIAAIKPQASKPLDLSQLDWLGLQSAAASCEACTFGQGSQVCRKPFALNVQQSSAQVLIVLHESRPGADLLSVDEHRVLSNMLVSIGKSWDSVALTPLLKCANTVGEPLDAYSEAIQSCQAFLIRYIELTQPKLIIAMGALAAQSLIGVDDDIDNLKAETHEFEGLPLMVMNHPSELLLDPKLKAQAWRDLNLI